LPEDRVKVILEELYRRGARPRKRISMRLLTAASTAASVAGLIVILVLARGAEAPLMSISDVYGNYLMNYAVVRLQGVVDGVPYLDNSTGRLTIRFALDDGTGTMNVYAYQPVSLELLRLRRIPFPGDIVTVEVQLRVRETYTYGILQSAEQIEIESPAGEPVRVKKLTTDMEGLLVRASGAVTSSRLVSSGILFTLSTEGGEITVLAPELLRFYDQERYEELVEALRPGALVEVEGIVYLYKGSSPEIVVRGFEDLKLKPPEKPVVAKVADLPGLVGKKVKLQVEVLVEEYVSSSREYTLVLRDETGSAAARAKREVLMEADPFALSSGPASVVGRVAEGGLVVVEAIEPAAAWSGRYVRVGDLGTLEEGVFVAVRGSVRDLVKRATFAIFYLDDGTGSIKVFIPVSVLQRIGFEIEEGAELSVAGYTDVYRGELEIVVFSPLGVRGG